MGTTVVVVLLIAAAGLLVLLDRKRAPRPEREDSGALEYVYVFITTVYMILLSLVVVVMWNNIADVRADVGAEATSLQSLVQIADRMPAAEGAPLRVAASEYAKDVLSGEWPAAASAAPGDLPAGRVLARARAQLARPVAAGAQTGTIEDTALAQVNAISAARDDRLAKSADTVPPFLLFTLGALSLATLATPLALGLRADPVALSGFVLTTALVCLSFWFVVDLQSPYHGLVHVDSRPLREVAAVALSGQGG